MIFRNGPLWVYSCDYGETLLGYYSRMVHSTRSGEFSYCESALLVEAYHELRGDRLEAAKELSWNKLSDRCSIRPEAQLTSLNKTNNDKSGSPNSIHVKQLWFKVDDNVFLIKPFSEEKKRDFSAIAFEFKKKSCYGRISQIELTNTGSYSLTVTCFSKCVSPPNGRRYPSYFKFFDARTGVISVVISPAQVLFRVMLIDCSFVPGVMIAVTPIYRLS